MLARSFLQVRRAGPRALLRVGLERVLLAGVLRCGVGVTVCLWLFVSPPRRLACVCGVRRAVSARERLWAGVRGENSWRASGALAASRDVFVSLAKFGAFSRCEWSFGSPGVCLETSRRVAAARRRVLASGYDTETRRQRLRLQDLRQALAFRLRYGLVRHLSQGRRTARGSTGVKSRSESCFGPRENDDRDEFESSLLPL